MILIIMRSDFLLPTPFDRLARGEARPVSLAVKDVLFRQGAKPHALFYVVTGAVLLQRYTEAGQVVVLHRAKAGELIAEASLFSAVYHCDCVAVVGSSLVALSKAAVLRRMENNPEFSAALVQRFAGQIQRGRRQLELRAISSAKQRVLAGFADGWMAGTIVEFAADMGLTHEATFRALAQLVKDGDMTKEGRGKYALVKQ